MFVCEELMQELNHILDGLVSPDELTGNLPASQSEGLRASFSLDLEPEVLNVKLQLLIRDSSIEVFINLPHDFVNLSLRNGKA